MDDSEVHISAFMVNTWLNNNNCEITQKSGKIIHPQEKATLIINLTGDGIRTFVEQLGADGTAGIAPGPRPHAA